MNLKAPATRNRWVDYLRSGITVLVVAHHSALAYTTFARFDKVAYIRSTHPVVDIKRWVGLDIFENFNDVFFMFLMFFIGGLFLPKSIEKKGPPTFIKDRVYRLLIPFLLGGTLLMLIAYFPSYYLAHNDAGIVRYITDFFSVERWPVGPPWFIWVLFAFNLVFALLYPFAGQWLKWLGKAQWLQGRGKTTFVLTVYIMTWILYVPVAYAIGAGIWTGWGPFDFQLSRVLAYFGYFMLGVLVGYTDFNNGVFSKDVTLVKRWKSWVLLSLLLYTALTLNNRLHMLSKMGYYSLYVASCTASCIAFITCFRRFVSTPVYWWDSLSENAYLIYLIHYVFVTWIQFALLDLNIPAFVKFLVVFPSSLMLSWGLSILLRRIKLVRKYL